jgi:hypothetical protein
MYPNAKLARDVRKLMEKLPAALPSRRMAPGGKWTPRLTQREVDILYAALAHHEDYARTGRHEDVDVGAVVRRMSARIYRNDAAEKTVAEREDWFDPYAHLADRPKFLAFIKDMDLHLLEEVIVRVMCDLFRRRQKYLGGDVALAERSLKEIEAVESGEAA